MFLHIAAAAAALAAPVFGSGPGSKTVRALDPDTLKPLATSPAFPKTNQIESSPDGSLWVARTSHGLIFYEATTGKQVGVVDVPLDRAVVSWIAPDAILLVKNDNNADLRVVTPSLGKVTRTVPIGLHVLSTARLGDRQVVFARAPGRNGVLKIYDAEGELERSVDLPGAFYGGIDPGSPDGLAIVPTYDKRIFSVDLATGAVKQRKFPTKYAGSLDYLTSQTPGAIGVQTYSHGTFGYQLLNPRTLAPTMTIAASSSRPSGGGFLTFNGFANGNGPVTQYDAAAHKVWALPRTHVQELTTIGDRVYLATSCTKFSVYDAGTGTPTGSASGGTVDIFGPSRGTDQRDELYTGYCD